jgi:hypothetical protein
MTAIWKAQARRFGIASLVALLLLTADARATKTAGASALSAWPVVSSPNAGPGDNQLEGATALSSADAWAVGRYYDTASGETKTLTEHWNGSAWTVVPSANAGAGGIRSLEDVDAVSAADVWAVGYFVEDASSEGGSKTMVEHWDGSEWEIVASPNAGLGEGGNGTLASVFALATDDVWAVGSYFPAVDSPTLQPPIEHWNGETWEIVPGPRRSPGTWSELKGISGSGPADIWAVGVRDAQVGDAVTERGLILHWDGEAWKRVRAPLPAARLTPFLLHDVVALSATNAWAVGALATRSSHRTVILHWDGHAWEVVRSANPSAQFQDLTAVTALSETRVWTVGTYWDADAKRMRTLVERWTGERWRRVTSSNRGNSELRDVAATRGARFAVGESGLESTRTLVLHHRVRTP